MLPRDPFISRGIEIAGYCSPATYVGGDYYDCLAVGDERHALIIADVTGHGFYSGLLVAMAKSCFHTQAHIDASPENVMSSLRRTLEFSILESLLVSCCFVLFDLANRTLSYANAGHPYPLLYHRSGEYLERLESTAPPLGIPYLDEARYETRQACWTPGDVLLLFSDGVTEARNAHGRFFDDSRLEESFLERRHESTVSIRDGLLRTVETFRGDTPPDDDVTLVVARASAHPSPSESQPHVGRIPRKKLASRTDG